MVTISKRTTSDNNELKSSKTEEYANTVSFDGDGNLEIVSNNAHLRYNSASNQLRFRYYKSTSYTNQQAIQLYKINFAKTLMGEISCNIEGTSSPSGSWSALESYYGTLSTTDKALFTGATYTKSGSGAQTIVKATGTTTQEVANAVAKYDYIVGKYNPTYSTTSTWKDFLGREPDPIGAGAYKAFFNPESNAASTTAAIVIISIVSLAAVGGFFFIRKKKIVK